MAEDAAGRRFGAVTREGTREGAVGIDPEAARRIQRDYGAWATVYDWFARATASIGGVRASCVAALDLDPGDTVVEFGCGPTVSRSAGRLGPGPQPNSTTVSPGSISSAERQSSRTPPTPVVARAVQS